jgi:hypothetical protein
MLPILTQEEENKLKLFDAMFRTLSSEEITQLISEGMVAEKLKGNIDQPGIFSSIYRENIVLYTRIIELEGKQFTMQQDMRDLVQSLNQTVFNQNNLHTFTNLKYRHNVY